MAVVRDGLFSFFPHGAVWPQRANDGQSGMRMRMLVAASHSAAKALERAGDARRQINKDASALLKHGFATQTSLPTACSSLGGLLAIYIPRASCEPYFVLFCTHGPLASPPNIRYACLPACPPAAGSALSAPATFDPD